MLELSKQGYDSAVLALEEGLNLMQQYSMKVVVCSVRTALLRFARMPGPNDYICRL